MELSHPLEKQHIKIKDRFGLAKLWTHRGAAREPPKAVETSSPAGVCEAHSSQRYQVKSFLPSFFSKRENQVLLEPCIVPGRSPGAS